MKKENSKYNKATKKMNNETPNSTSLNLNNSESTPKPQNNYPSDIQSLFERLGLI
ncbi:hypothetical protein SAMN06265371_102217 [Lutibacter agarilyticus]|uniref:Uncharacterized protein n=1 Tax=Lutibacter agarilyticus TaxID=1109740 RepID=A0A238VZV5_9FLAO|nr:hypothetical protein [Lutibacter agarilyticus]SNR38989.1 hypothetical protein SAMN06265371_102217 [Lutibacter agarilyticus]